MDYKKLSDSELLSLRKNYIVAGDTDSVYVSFGDIADKLDGPNIEKSRKLDKIVENLFIPFIKDSYDELYNYMGAYQQKMNMSREVIASAGLWRAKKNYALYVYNNEGVEYEKPHLKIMGLESVKSNTPSICRTAIQDVIRLIFTKSEKDVQSYITDFKNRFMNADPVEIAKPTTIRDIEKYYVPDLQFLTRTPIHVKASLLHNYLIRTLNLENVYEPIISDDQIKFVYLKVASKLEPNTLAFKNEFPEKFKYKDRIDYHTQWEVTFLKPIKSILTIIGYSEKPIATLF